MLKYWLADLADYADLLETARRSKVFSKRCTYFFSTNARIIFLCIKLNFYDLFVHSWQYSAAYSFIADKIFAPQRIMHVK
jgi:hypothetical protein